MARVYIDFMGWCLLVMFTGFYILRKYRTTRKNGSRRYLGREALLIGALTAFICQTLIGLFLFNRSINGAAMLTYMSSAISVDGVIGYPAKNLQPALMAPLAQASFPCIKN